MEWLSNAVYYVVPFIVLLGILVFVHEFGHFLMARICGVQVTDFSIGFGRELCKFTDKYKTTWKICLIPLGGYCQFLGDSDAASTGSDQEVVRQMTPEEKKRAFPYQSTWKKLLIVLGGPGFNYLFAILVFTALFVFIGKLNFPPVVGGIVDNGPAAKAGIKVNDRVLEVNGHPIKDFSDISTEISLTTEGSADIKLQRGDDVFNVTVVLEELEAERNGRLEKRPMLGISSPTSIQVSTNRLPLHTALAEAGVETWKITEGTLRGVWQMITGRRGSEDLGGILRIAEMSGDISKKNGLLDFVVFMALLSVNLGLINLFPIPVLDGGHVVIYTVELITRREVNEKVKEILFRVGFGLIIALMLFATWNDFVHLFKRWFS